MDLDSILREITSGLTGDADTDVKYLYAQMEKYKGHEFSQEISRACGRLIYQAIPEEDKAKFSNVINNDMKSIDATIDEVKFAMYQHDVEKAYKLNSALVEKIENAKMFENDTKSEYYNFNEMFEEVLYVTLNNVKKDVREASLPYAFIYFLQGNILFEMGRLSEAKVYLEKSLRWNPVSCAYAFEYMEIFKQEKDYNRFFELNKAQHKYAYKPDHMARYYRNAGFYFTEIKEYKGAMGCYLISLAYEPGNKNAQSELYYIQNIAPGTKEPTSDELKNICDKYGISPSPSEDVLRLSAFYGQEAMKTKHNEAALYYLQIFYNLTDNKEVGKMISELKASMGLDKTGNK